MTARLSGPPPGRHTRIFQLTPAHLDELLRRKIARDDAARTPASKGGQRRLQAEPPRPQATGKAVKG